MAPGSSFVSSACATLAAPVGVAELIFMYAGGAKRLATKGPEGRLRAEIIFFQNNQHIWSNQLVIGLSALLISSLPACKFHEGRDPLYFIHHNTCTTHYSAGIQIYLGMNHDFVYLKSVSVLNGRTVSFHKPAGSTALWWHFIKAQLLSLLGK